MNAWIHSLGDTLNHSSIDANWRYCRTEIDEKHRDNISLTSSHKLYQFVKICFGPWNAFVTIQRAVDIFFLPVKWQSAWGYHAVIFSFSEFFKEHV